MLLTSTAAAETLFRPTYALGSSFGSQEIDEMSASLRRGMFRFSFPIAYYPSKHLALRAGPDLLLVGTSVKPDGGPQDSYLTFTGGFGVSAGYVF